MARNIEVKVPDLGDTHDVPIIELLVKEGDKVAKETPLLTLESEKATMDVPSPGEGVIRGLKVKIGDKLNKGDLICELESAEAAAAAPAPEKPASAEPAKAAAKKPAPRPEEPAAETAPASGGATVEIKVPDLGDTHDVPVIELLVKEGDTVAKDTPLLTLESEKATMDVPSPGAGVIRGLKVKVGDKLNKGDVISSLETTGAAVAAAAPKSEAATAQPKEAEPAMKPAEPAKAVAAVAETPQAASGKPGELPYAGPATRKFARELGVDLAKVKGSAARGRIVIEDVQAFVKTQLAAPKASTMAGSGIPPIPTVDFSQFGEIETRPLARIRKLSAAHLHRAWLNVPHVTQTDEVDITELEAFRKSQSEESGVKLTLLPFIIKAVAAALKAYPEFAASLSPDGESLILKKYTHIGFAADTPNGLVVPVVRNADQKGIVQLAQETAELAKKARDGKLKADEMKGGCFSISSLGGIGGSFFTPIVNAPEVGILGVSRSQLKPVWNGREFTPRLLCPLSLSYDHRVIDGAYAARFIVALGKLLSDLRRLSL